MSNSQSHHSATNKAANSIINIFQAQQCANERAEFDVYDFPDKKISDGQTHHSATDKATDLIADTFQANQCPYKQAGFDVYAFPDKQMSNSQSHNSATDKAAYSISHIFQAQCANNWNWAKMLYLFSSILLHIYSHHYYYIY